MAEETGYVIGKMHNDSMSGSEGNMITRKYSAGGGVSL